MSTELVRDNNMHDVGNSQSTHDRHSYDNNSVDYSVVFWFVCYIFYGLYSTALFIDFAPALRVRIDRHPYNEDSAVGEIVMTKRGGIHRSLQEAITNF